MVSGQLRTIPQAYSAGLREGAARERARLTKMFEAAVTTRMFDGGAEVLLCGEPLDRCFAPAQSTALGAWCDARVKLIRAVIAKAIREAPP